MVNVLKMLRERHSNRRYTDPLLCAPRLNCKRASHAPQRSSTVQSRSLAGCRRLSASTRTRATQMGARCSNSVMTFPRRMVENSTLDFKCVTPHLIFKMIGDDNFFGRKNDRRKKYVFRGGRRSRGAPPTACFTASNARRTRVFRVRAIDSISGARIERSRLLGQIPCLVCVTPNSSSASG